MSWVNKHVFILYACSDCGTGQDGKILGVYSTREGAETARSRICPTDNYIAIIKQTLKGNYFMIRGK